MNKTFILKIRLLLFYVYVYTFLISILYLLYMFEKFEVDVEQLRLIIINIASIADQLPDIEQDP